MPYDVEATLHTLVTALAQDSPICAIGLSGGDRPFPNPGEGDIDLFLYCTNIPGPEERGARLKSLREVEHVEVAKLKGGHWGEGDCCSIAGVETWLLYFTLEETRFELEEILAGKHPGRLDSYFYPIGRCATWKRMRALYDPDGFLGSLKERLRQYPEGLAQALIDHHLTALDDREDLERAVQRKDILFFHFALDLALDHFLQALFALNREYFPSRKRSDAYLQRFRVKPAECERRLHQVVALGGNAERLEQAYEVWKGLVGDLKVPGTAL